MKTVLCLFFVCASMFAAQTGALIEVKESFNTGPAEAAGSGHPRKGWQEVPALPKGFGVSLQRAGLPYWLAGRVYSYPNSERISCAKTAYNRSGLWVRKSDIELFRTESGRKELRRIYAECLAEANSNYRLSGIFTEVIDDSRPMLIDPLVLPLPRR